MTIAATKQLLERYPNVVQRQEGPLHLGPASIDLHLKASKIYVLSDITLSQLGLADYEEVEFDGGTVIPPGHLYIMETEERVNIPTDIACQVASRSSYGRLGLQVCGNAGFIDPGFRGSITLELFSVAGDIVIRPGERVAQLIFWNLDHPTDGYSGKYQNQVGATRSRPDIP